MSDREDILEPSAMSVQALITPVVAVLLILAGVVLSVLLTGTSMQNNAEIARSVQLIDTAFKTVGRDLGRVAVTLARSGDAYEHLVLNPDPAWAEDHFSAVHSGFGAVAVMVIDVDDSVRFRSRTRATPRASWSCARARRRARRARSRRRWTRCSG